MTIQDFIPIWQAQPFRAFRVHTMRGVFDVKYPMAASLTREMRIAVVVDDSRVETFALDEITQCEAFGAPMSVADAMSAIPPEILARHAQLLSQALSATEREPEASSVPPASAFDSGRVSMISEHGPDGIHVVRATVHTRDGVKMLSTADTRWNVHGVEQFENGTSLYLHHLDHPIDEQRIILWPPDTGTFESFAEGMPAAALEEQLRRRDEELAAKPAKPVEPPASYFRKITREWEIGEIDGRAEAFGEDEAALDPDRYEFVLVPRIAESGREVANPVLTDIMREEIIFNLVDTDWDATGDRDGRNWHISLRHASSPGEATVLHVVDVDRRGAMSDASTILRPLAWIERHLRNFGLYESWNVMYDALLAGPVKRNTPDVVIPLENGFSAELWAGEPRFPTPFLQPHIVDAQGRTVFDLRSTTWSARIRTDQKRPRVILVFSSGVQEAREIASQYPLELDLISHRVTCPNLEGSTTIGMVQALIRRVRGVPWMLEEIPKWFEKGRTLPLTRPGA
jgi:hypothetical protein